MEPINIKELAKGITDNLTGKELFDESELNSDLISAKLEYDKKYDKPINLLQIIEENKVVKDVLTSNNISTTIGGAKSKKTFFATMVISSLLGCKDFGMIGNLQGLNVVLFDTEQSFYHVQKIAYRINKLLGKLNNVEIYALRQYSPEKRMAIVEYYLDKNKGKYSFIIIDGVVDLLYDFNDLKESKTVSSKLLEWSAVYNCHINSILHTNKDQNYARGHLGSELMNKSETVFRINKEDDNSSKVICEMSRNMGFNEFTFHIDKGLPKRMDLPSGFYNNSPENREPLEKLINNDEGLINNKSFSEESNIPF